MGLQELTDRAELAELVTRQSLWLDERRFDDAGAIFTEDASVVTQGGRSQGLDDIARQAERVHTRFDRTQHVTSNVLIDLDGDRATVKANLIAAFVHDPAPEPALMVGERYHFEAVRTPRGWRFSRVEITPLWRSDEPPR
jgi:hypothetical protein